MIMMGKLVEWALENPKLAIKTTASIAFIGVALISQIDDKGLRFGASVLWCFVTIVLAAFAAYAHAYSDKDGEP